MCCFQRHTPDVQGLECQDDLVQPGPVMGNPAGPLTGGYGWPAPNLEEAIPPGLESLPTPPAKGVGDDRAATRAMRLATRYV